MANGSLNVAPVARNWWVEDGRSKWFTYIVVPVVIGFAIYRLRLEADNLGSLLTGCTVLTASLFGMLFQVYTWSQDASAAIDETPADDIGLAWQLERHRRRLHAIRRLYSGLCWALLVSLALTVALLVLNTESEKSQGGRDLVVTTSIVGVLGTHLLLLILASVNRLFIITRSTVNQHKAEAPA
ncbi:MAG TPA: hypothetical protein VNE62_06110 [Actinomycetota bacterium]|nr:hypothetical protein [Actinomycetota bacterium]